MWVRLESIQYIANKHGKDIRHHPGEWVNIGTHLANQWVLTGAATLPPSISFEDHDDIGVWVPTEAAAKRVKQMMPGLTRIQSSPDIELFTDKMLCWDGVVPFQPDLLVSGFGLLDTWEIAVPLWRYDVLADGVGNAEQRAIVEKTVRDLRVPCYEPGLMFARNVSRVRRLIDLWRRREVADSKLSFLQALYKVKPFILALPSSWIAA